jgi:hypothetical protein
MDLDQVVVAKADHLVVPLKEEASNLSVTR